MTDSLKKIIFYILISGKSDKYIFSELFWICIKTRIVGKFNSQKCDFVLEIYCDLRYNNCRKKITHNIFQNQDFCCAKSDWSHVN